MSDLSVVLVGFSIVFLVMIIITVSLLLFPVIFGTKKKKETVTETVDAHVIPEQNETDDSELVAVITAAIADYNKKTGKTSNFRVKSFKRIGRSDR